MLSLGRGDASTDAAAVSDAADPRSMRRRLAAGGTGGGTGVPGVTGGASGLRGVGAA